MGIYRVQYLRDTSHEWADFSKGDSNDISFEKMEEAWAWARKRSRLPGHTSTIYRCWNTAQNRQEGAPYMNGNTIEAEKEANRRLSKSKGKGEMIADVYELFWKSSNSGTWTAFDTKDTQYFGIKEATKRVGQSSFSGKHDVRIWRNSEIIFEGKARTTELVAWLEAYASGTLLHHTTQGQEASPMEYEARKALSVPRLTLVEKLEENIAEAKAKHDENKAKEEAALADRITALKAMVKENPAGLVKTIEGYISGTFFAKDDKGEFANSKTYISNYDGSTAEFVPDATATKLISVLNAAVDETIEVTPSDDFYRYL